MKDDVPLLEESFELGEVLGTGSFGEVRAATRRTDGTRVAVKVAHGSAPPLAGADGDARILREARLLRGIEHPHLVRFHGHYRDSAGELALVYALVEGEELADQIRPGGLPLSRVLPWIDDIAAGLDALHKAGLRHRDLKCENVRLTPESRAIILDFGLAKPLQSGASLTAAGVMMGTPHTLPPEELRGETVGPGGDLYSLACMAYRLLSGNPPFSGTLHEVISGHLQTPPPRLGRADLPGSLDAVFARGLAKDPGDRFERASDLATALREAAHRKPKAGEETAASSAQTRHVTEAKGPLSATAPRGPVTTPDAAFAPPSLTSTRSGPFWVRSTLGVASILVFLGTTWWYRASSPPAQAPPSVPVPAEISPSDLPTTSELFWLQGISNLEQKLDPVEPFSRHPADWPQVVDRLPTLWHFYQWIAGGGRPEDLPEGTRTKLRELDEAFDRRGLTEPFYPYIWQQPATQKRLAPGGWQLGKGTFWKKRPLVGWAAIAAHSWRNLRLAVEKAEAEVTQLGPGQHPFPNLGTPAIVSEKTRRNGAKRSRFEAAIAIDDGFRATSMRQLDGIFEPISVEQRAANLESWLTWTKAGRRARRAWTYALGRTIAARPSDEAWQWFNLAYFLDNRHETAYILDGASFLPWAQRAGQSGDTAALDALRVSLDRSLHNIYYSRFDNDIRGPFARDALRRALEIRDRLVAAKAQPPSPDAREQARMLFTAWRLATELRHHPATAKKLWKRLSSDTESLRSWGACTLVIEVMNVLRQTEPGLFTDRASEQAYVEAYISRCEAGQAKPSMVQRFLSKRQGLERNRRRSP